MRINVASYNIARLSAFLLMTLLMSLSCKKGVSPGGNNTNITFWGGPNDYHIVNMISTSDGGYLVCGNNAINNITFLVKFDGAGHKQWSNSYRMIVCTDIVPTEDGGCAMQGYPDTTTLKVIVLKTNSSGATEWGAGYYDTIASPIPNALCTDHHGNFYATGQIFYYNSTIKTSAYALYVYKINENHKLSWFKTYPGLNQYPAYIYRPQNAMIDAQGMLVLDAVANGGEQILKMDTSGVLNLQHTLNRQTVDTAYLQNSYLIQNADGSYQAAFDQVSNNGKPGHPVHQFFYHNLYSVTISNDFKQKTIVHLDSVYNVNINTTPLTSGALMNVPFVQLANGNLLEAIPLMTYNGYSQQQGQFSFIVKNPQGKVILNKTLPGWPSNIIQDKNGNYFICGLSLNPDSDTRCVFAMYIDANGNNIN